MLLAARSGSFELKELTKRTEDDERESVPEEKFKNAPKAHQETSDEVVGANGSNAISAGPPPAHELARKRAETEQEAKECQWRRVCECVPELTLDRVLWVEVYLLKQLGTDSDRIGSTYFVDSFIGRYIPALMIG